MMNKLMRSTVTAAAFAALIFSGACASNKGLGDNTDTSDQVAQVRPEETGDAATVAPAPGPAKVDRDGNVYASSSAPGWSASRYLRSHSSRFFASTAPTSSLQVHRPYPETRRAPGRSQYRVGVRTVPSSFHAPSATRASGS